MHDATALLGRLQLPSGAKRVAAEPAGDGGVLAHPRSGPVATRTVIDRHRWWTANGGYASVTSFIQAHAPRGAKLNGFGSGSQAPGLPVGHYLAYHLPAVTGVLFSRDLVIVLVDLSGGRTGIRADAQIRRTIPRRSGERIPAGAHELDIARGRLHGHAGVSLHVTKAAEVHRLAAMIDRLQTVQPGAWSCPSMQANPPVVTFTFRARLGGPAPAVASELASATEPTTPCDPMTFTVRGHPRTPLLDGAAVVGAAARMLGVRLRSPIRQ